MFITRVPTQHGTKIVFDHRRRVSEDRDVLLWSKGNVLIFPMIQNAKKILKEPLELGIKRVFVVKGIKFHEKPKKSFIMSDDDVDGRKTPQEVRKQQLVVQSIHEEAGAVHEEIEEDGSYKPPPIWRII